MAGEETPVSADVAKAFGAKKSMPTLSNQLKERKKMVPKNLKFEAAWNLKDE